MKLVSASQISMYRECSRKWAWRYIEGIETPQHPAAALGTEVDDEQIQPYLRGEANAFDARPSGRIAQSMLPYLPAPKTVQTQKHFVIPSPTWLGPNDHVGFGFQGYMDLYSTDGRVFGLGMPDLEVFGAQGPTTICGAFPAVGDTKTTADIGKWAKSAKTLSTDVQAMLYATAAMFETGKRVVDLAWIYGQTRGPNKAKRVHLRVYADHVAEQFSAINATALEMWEVRQSGVGALDLPPNPDACEAYGGCPYRDRCNLSPAQVMDAYVAKHHAKEDMTMTNAVVGGVDAGAAVAALRAKKAARLAGQAPPPAPAAADAAPAAPPPSPPLGINPPESALVDPAAPLPPPPAKRGPGRPKKAAPPPDLLPADEANVTPHIDVPVAALMAAYRKISEGYAELATALGGGQ